METYQVCLEKLVEEFQFQVWCCKEKIPEIFVECPDLNRPGLELAGYSKQFSNDRIQLLGNVEMFYLKELSMQTRKKKLEGIFSFGFPCMIIARGMKPFPELLSIAEKYQIPVFGAEETTTEVYSALNRFLSVQLAPRETMHAGLVEVYGEGVLITGNSGVGKSETALELVKRGHRLVADDLVEIRRVSNKTLVGAAPDIIRHFIEIRGIGLLDVRRLYGVGAVKMTENIHLVISLEHWEEGKEYDRVGLEDQYTDILGIRVPSLTIPVRPGRNLAIIVEVAAMNSRQKMMGYNAAKELNRRVFEGNAGLKGGSFSDTGPWR